MPGSSEIPAATFRHVSKPVPWPEYLARTMRARGFTQAELGRQSGLGQSLISRWLRGESQPDLPNLRKLGKVLGVPFLELAVAAGHIDPKEAQLKDAPSPPPVPVGGGVDPRVLARLAKMDPAEVERVLDFIDDIRGR